MTYSKDKAYNVCPCQCYRCKNMRGYAALANKVFGKCWHDTKFCPNPVQTPYNSKKAE